MKKAQGQWSSDGQTFHQQGFFYNVQADRSGPATKDYCAPMTFTRQEMQQSADNGSKASIEAMKSAPKQ